MRETVRQKIDLGMGAVVVCGVVGLGVITGSRPWSLTRISLLGLGLSAGVAFLGAGLDSSFLKRVESQRLSGAGVALIGALLVTANLRSFGGYEGVGTIIGFAGLIGGVFAAGIGVNRAIGRADSGVSSGSERERNPDSESEAESESDE